MYPFVYSTDFMKIRINDFYLVKDNSMENDVLFIFYNEFFVFYFIMFILDYDFGVTGLEFQSRHYVCSWKNFVFLFGA